MGTAHRDGNLISGKRLRLDLLHRLSQRPELYAGRERSFWTDPYVSKHVVEAHLDPNTEDASRRPHHISATVEKIVEHYRNSPAAAGKRLPRLLDVACGPGLYAQQLAAHGFDVTGIDFSQASINEARKQAKRCRLAITYIHQDLTATDLGGPYDVIALIYGEFCTLSEDERRSFLDRARASLIPGGLLIFDVFTEPYVLRNRRCDEWHVSTREGFWQAGPHLVLLQHFHYPRHSASVARYVVVDQNGDYRLFHVWWRHYTPQEITAQLRNHGFDVEALYGSLWGEPLEENGEWVGVYARAAG